MNSSSADTHPEHLCRNKTKYAHPLFKIQAGLDRAKTAPIKQAQRTTHASESTKNYLYRAYHDVSKSAKIKN